MTLHLMVCKPPRAKIARDTWACSTCNRRWRTYWDELERLGWMLMD